MESFIVRLFFQNWQRKGIALIAALVIWIVVNQSITDTKTIPNVPIKVVSLPADKTIIGLMPNGYISQRIALTLSGSQSVIRELDQGDLEVVLDASTASSDDWVVRITKKNIMSLNPNVNPRHHINSVEHPDFVLTLSQLVTEKIPIYVKTPKGETPEGYEYLDIWPEKLMQTLSGPAEEIRNLKAKGLKLILDLDKITKEDLDHLKLSKKHGHDDEISFVVPEKWKQVPIPFRHNIPQEINDPEARNLRIDFLKQSLIPVGKEIPLVVFYPPKYSDSINPQTHKLAKSDHVRYEHDVPMFSIPLYVRDVSRLFLDIVRDNIEIVIVAAPQSEREVLQWSLEVIDTQEMENTYVAYVIAEQKESGVHTMEPKKREDILRKRFREYMRKLSLYTADGNKLEIFGVLEGNSILIKSE